MAKGQGLLPTLIGQQGKRGLYVNFVEPIVDENAIHLSELELYVREAVKQEDGDALDDIGNEIAVPELIGIVM